MLKINNSIFLFSSKNKNNWLKDNIKEFFLIGKSNVGKSSFINMLTNNNKLAKISKNPGKTKMINFFSINNNQFRIIDSPGYGYSNINKLEKIFINKILYNFLKNRKNIVLICFLLDLRRIPNENDIKFFNFLKSIKKPILILGTKLDKLKKNDFLKNEKNIKNILNIEKNDLFLKISNKNKFNKNECLKIFFNYL